ncbi:MAG: SAM hydrolase/SAM-dependent halogenase family protein [Halodesulfurarchaeum sp.]
MITITTDFGSPYPAAMKGVILKRVDTRLVDVSHDLPRQDVRAAAFWLRELLTEFPPAVHLVVVDPGVGTDRKVLIVEAGDHRLVGPDNGVLVPAGESLSDSPTYYAGKPSDPESTTFHGRDVFAPIAADVEADGIEAAVEAAGLKPVADPVRLEFPAPNVEDEEALGEVLVVDDFGNAITNIPGEFLEDLDGDWLLVDGRWTRVGRTYATVPPGDPVVTIGSHGNVELSVNQGRGDDTFNLEAGETVYLVRTD